MQWERFCLILSIIIRAGAIYFAVTALFCLKKPKPYRQCAPKTRFAILIAARNEENVIGALVKSLLEQDYPAGLRDVYVIPNNCTDDTEAAARAAGAGIIQCLAPVRSKGDALHQAMEQLLPRDYDAFCVFDADNVVDRRFLSSMNDAFCAGARVAKARMQAKNPYDSWVAGCYGIYFGLFDLFYNRPRANLGLSAKLVGTGFAVHREVLKAMGGWNTTSLAEDAEFSAQCALLGERVWWVPGAITYDEAPNSFRVSLYQRRRWCSGIMEVGAVMVPGLLRSLRQGCASRKLDVALMFIEPYAQVVGLLPTLLLVCGAVGQGTLWELCARTAGTGLLALGVMIAVAVLAAGTSGYRLRRMGRSFVCFPIFMAAWLPLQVIGLLRPVRVWQEIRHGRTVAEGELPRVRIG